MEEIAGERTAAALISRAEELIDGAAAEEVTLRLIGSLAIRRCSGDLHELAREPCQDIDLVGLGRQSVAIRELLEQRGYGLDPSLVVSQEYGVRRLIFLAPELPKVDVFLDDLEMSHTVPLADRLGLDSPTVTRVDLLLSKLQIHDLTVKDVQDVIALLAAHPLGDDQGTIDVRHLVALLRADWGFWQTATTNLGQVHDYVKAHPRLGDPGAPTCWASSTRSPARWRRAEDDALACPRTRRHAPPLVGGGLGCRRVGSPTRSP